LWLSHFWNTWPIIIEAHWNGRAHLDMTLKTCSQYSQVNQSLGAFDFPVMLWFLKFMSMTIKLRAICQVYYWVALSKQISTSSDYHGCSEWCINRKILYYHQFIQVLMNNIYNLLLNLNLHTLYIMTFKRNWSCWFSISVNTDKQHGCYNVCPHLHSVSVIYMYMYHLLALF
jgi:hypothetical protein